MFSTGAKLLLYYSWETWITSCGNYISSTTYDHSSLPLSQKILDGQAARYLPSPLPAGESIPYFAGTNRKYMSSYVVDVTHLYIFSANDWINGIFNATQAAMTGSGGIYPLDKHT